MLFSSLRSVVLHHTVLILEAERRELLSNLECGKLTQVFLS